MRRYAAVTAFFAYQISWFACILQPPGWWLSAAYLPVHLRLLGRPGEWRVVLSTLLVGGLTDSALTLTGVFQFPGWSLPVAPLWLWLIWALFATTLSHTLRWMRGRWIAAAAMGVLAGPGGWSAGVEYGVVTFGTPHAPLILAVVWGALLPGVVGLSGWLEQVQEGGREESGGGER